MIWSNHATYAISWIMSLCISLRHKQLIMYNVLQIYSISCLYDICYMCACMYASLNNWTVPCMPEIFQICKCRNNLVYQQLDSWEIAVINDSFSLTSAVLIDLFTHKLLDNKSCKLDRRYNMCTGAGGGLYIRILGRSAPIYWFNF